jgi:hypothetical protein
VLCALREKKETIMKNNTTSSSHQSVRQSSFFGSSRRSSSARPAPPAPVAPARAQVRQVARPVLDLELRAENRWLPAIKVMSALRAQFPAEVRFAKAVGYWVWVTFPEAPAESVRFFLSQLGFSWVRARQAWQHPCGQFPSQRGPEVQPHF